MRLKLRLRRDAGELAPRSAGYSRMFSPEEIDAVLRDAQSAVDDLAQDVTRASQGSGASPAVAAPAAARPVHQSKVAAGAAHPASPKGLGRERSSRPKHIQRIMRLRVPVRVHLAQRPMPVGEILKIMPGSILEFEQSVEDELALMVNNREIGRGVAVKVNEHFGLRITSIGDLASRIRSLGTG